MSTALTTGDTGRARVPTDDDIAAAHQLSRQWGWVLAGGIVAMLVGIAVLSIRWDVDRLATFAGLVFAIRGVTEIATSGSRPNRGLAILGGVLGIVAAVVMFSWPGPTLFVLATLTGIWLAMWGIFAIVAALFERGHLWGLWLIAGIAAIPLGGWALGHPEATLAVVVAVIGIWAMIGGLLEVFAAFELRKLPEALEAMRHSTNPVAAGTSAPTAVRSAPGSAPRPAPAG